MGQPCAEHGADQLGGDVRDQQARPSSPRNAIAIDTAGLKWAPLIGANTSMRTYKPPTVAAVLASKAIGGIAARKALAHDPRADDDGDEEKRAEALGEDAPKRPCTAA